MVQVNINDMLLPGADYKHAPAIAFDDSDGATAVMLRTIDSMRGYTVQVTTDRESFEAEIIETSQDTALIYGVTVRRWLDDDLEVAAAEVEFVSLIDLRRLLVH